MSAFPGDLYERIAAYAAKYGQPPDRLVIDWITERLAIVEIPAPAQPLTPEEELAQLGGSISVPVERDWADQHDLYFAGNFNI